jgi:putative Mg2+ transporter-C (MgtC) family protein
MEIAGGPFTGWRQILELAVAWGLSALIGFERELKQKSAGVRTYTVVGFGSALFMLVSKYGFTDILTSGEVVLDPSRVAAQIVSGLGFIGGGIIFVKRDSVRGLTTAASIWLTAAVGAAAGAGLLTLAAVSTGIYFITILGLRPAASTVSHWFGAGRPTLRVRYLDGRGLLRNILALVSEMGFLVADTQSTHHTEPADQQTDESPSGPWIELQISLNGRGNVTGLVTALAELDGVLGVDTLDEDDV